MDVNGTGGRDMAGLQMPRGDDSGGHGPLTLLLSLTLILLALFILLGAAMRQNGGQAGMPQLAQGAGNGRQELVQPVDDLQRAIRGSVASRLQLVTPDMAEDAGGLWLTLPVAQLFDGQGRLRAAAQAWMADVGQLLQGVGQDWHGRLIVQGRAAETVVLAGQTVALAQALGLAQTQVMVGYAVAVSEAGIGKVVLQLQAPAGVVNGRNVERLQQGLERTGGQVHGIPGGVPVQRQSVTHD